MQTPIPGQFWPEQSAHYAGPVAYPDGNVYALLLPAQPEKLVAKHSWGKYGKKIEGATSLHDGLVNTQAMAAAGSKLAKTALAADDGLYLPSRFEALQLFATLKDQVGEGWVWTSTQCSAFTAWYQYFYDGYQFIYYKDAELRAVAVRRLLLHSFSALSGDAK